MERGVPPLERRSMNCWEEVADYALDWTVRHAVA
jgi:hypothetical protein